MTTTIEVKEAANLGGLKEYPIFRNRLGRFFLRLVLVVYLIGVFVVGLGGLVSSMMGLPNVAAWRKLENVAFAAIGWPVVLPLKLRLPIEMRDDKLPNPSATAKIKLKPPEVKTEAVPIQKEQIKNTLASH